MLRPIVINANARSTISKLRGLLKERRWPELERDLLAGIADAPDRFLAMVRHGGLFRPSSASFEVSSLRRVVEGCGEEYVERLPEDMEGRDYFRSIEALLTFSTKIEREIKQLRRAILDDPAGSVMGMAGELGLAFYAVEDPEIARRYKLSQDFEPVELADALSLAIQMLVDAGKPSSSFVGLMDIHRAEKGHYRTLLEDFVALQSLRECEILVDRLGYTAHLDHEGWLNIAPPNGRTGKSLAHGFAAFRAAQFSWPDELNARTKSLREAIRGRATSNSLAFARIETKPFTRIRVELPLPLVEFVGAIKGLLPEEMALVGAESVGALCNPDELLTLEVTRGLSLGDMLLGQRMVRLASGLLIEGLLRLEPQPRAAALRSMLPTFAITDLTKLIEPAIGAEKAAAFCGALFDGAGDDPRFDILYNPAFGVPNCFALLLPVAHHANLIRNGLKRWGERPSSLGGPRLEAMLESLFVECGGRAAKGVVVNAGGEAGEIDVLAQVEGKLFMFECKSGLFPGGYLEMQPILDQLEKGSSQILKLSAELSKPAVLTEIASKLGWQVADASIAPMGVVVTNTRMLAGSCPWGVPIHSWLELENYARNGLVRFGSCGVRVRAEGRLHATDLEAFISGRRVHEHVFSFLCPYLKDKRLGRFGIREPQMAMAFESENAVTSALSSWSRSAQ